MAKPLYPEHGQEYLVAMLEAAEEYDAWVDSRKGKKGMKVFAIRSNKLEDTDANV